MRKLLVYTMREGESLVLHCDKIAPDFTNTYTGPADQWSP